MLLVSALCLLLPLSTVCSETCNSTASRRVAQVSNKYAVDHQADPFRSGECRDETADKTYFVNFCAHSSNGVWKRKVRFSEDSELKENCAKWTVQSLDFNLPISCLDKTSRVANDFFIDFEATVSKLKVNVEGKELSVSDALDDSLKLKEEEDQFLWVIYGGRYRQTSLGGQLADKLKKAGRQVITMTSSDVPKEDEDNIPACWADDAEKRILDKESQVCHVSGADVATAKIGESIQRIMFLASAAKKKVHFFDLFARYPGFATKDEREILYNNYAVQKEIVAALEEDSKQLHRFHLGSTEAVQIADKSGTVVFETTEKTGYYSGPNDKSYNLEPMKPAKPAVVGSSNSGYAVSKLASDLVVASLFTDERHHTKSDLASVAKALAESLKADEFNKVPPSHSHELQADLANCVNHVVNQGFDAKKPYSEYEDLISEVPTPSMPELKASTDSKYSEKCRAVGAAYYAGVKLMERAGSNTNFGRKHNDRVLINWPIRVAMTSMHESRNAVAKTALGLSKKLEGWIKANVLQSTTFIFANMMELEIFEEK